MKNYHGKMKFSALALAVGGALTQMYALPVYAVDDEVKALITPVNSIEMGAANVAQKSAKFGEYNGLNKDSATVVGNFSVSGGDAHGDGNGTTGWEVTGKDLGLTSREFGATISNQGQWKLGISYDELRHNASDGYQTPYQGSMGGNRFTLPADFNGTNAANTRTLSTAQKNDFQTMDIGSTRKNTSFSAGYNFNPQWGLKFDYNRLDQSGAKLKAFAADKFSGVGGATPESISILPNPTNYKTDTVNLALNWIGEKGHISTSYFGSFFRDAYNSVTWQTYQGALADNTMTTPPSNNFNQFNLAGGYAFSTKTKLTGSLSYGRNTQNDAFVSSAQMVTAAPQASLNGLVVTNHADLKLTDQTTKDLKLSAGFKYDERDNQTKSYMYNFNSYNANPANYPNTPLSNKKTQYELAGDYRLDAMQRLRLAYNREDVKRWCSQYAVGTVTYPSGTNCVVATASKDDKLSATYKLKASEDLDLNAGYSFSKRVTDSDTNAIVAMIKTVNGIAGLNGGNYIGFHPFFDGSRNQQAVRAGVNWQATQQLSFGLSGRGTVDQYHTLYGMSDGRSGSVNLDATYQYKEDGSVSAYMTQQNRTRDFTDAASTTTSFTDKLRDSDTTFGLGFKQGGLMAGKLGLSGDLTYALGRSGYMTQSNPSGTCAASGTLSCGNVPVIRSAMTSLKLTGTYEVDKKSKIAMMYLYQNLRSNDWMYNIYQMNLTPTTVMPTNETAGSYSVNMVSATYIYTF